MLFAYRTYINSITISYSLITVRKRFGSVRFVSRIKRFLWPAVRFGSLILVCGSVRFDSSQPMKYQESIVPKNWNIGSILRCIWNVRNRIVQFGCSSYSLIIFHWLGKYKSNILSPANNLSLVMSLLLVSCKLTVANKIPLIVASGSVRFDSWYFIG